MIKVFSFFNGKAVLAKQDTVNKPGHLGTAGLFTLIYGRIENFG